MSTQVTHMEDSWGLNRATLCGKSLHGWYIDRPKNVTELRREVTCKRCIAKFPTKGRG